jgi:hypothetical protein
MSLVDVGYLPYPSHYVSGVGQSAQIAAAEDHVASVFPIPKTGTLLKVGWRITVTNTPVLTMKVSLETVADVIGAPVATTDGGKTLYAANAQSAAISNPSAGVRFDSINGSNPSTGIAVTEGDLVSFVRRCTARSSGTLNVQLDQTGTIIVAGLTAAGGSTHPYEYKRLAGVATAYPGLPFLTLEYDTGFVTSPFLTPASLAQANDAFSSSSNPDRRGLKIAFPWTCRVLGAQLYIDSDSDFQFIFYDADEYTVLTGFPLSVSGNKRSASSANLMWVRFPTPPTLAANQAYRAVILPTTTTNLTMQTWTPADDGAVTGISGLVGGTNIIYTSRNGAPTSGSHAWTDDATKRSSFVFIVDQIDVGSGGGGGRPEFRGTNL